MFRNAYFLDSMTPSPHPNIPPYLHMLQHVVSRNSYNIMNCLVLYHTELCCNKQVFAELYHIQICTSVLCHTELYYGYL